MRYFYYVFCFLAIHNSCFAQDFLVSPGSNPTLFNTNIGSALGNKLLVSEDSFVYRYDTLNLPFIDDFSTDHFPKKVRNTSDPRVMDTLVYQIIMNGLPYRELEGFVKDTTGIFTLDFNDSIVSAIANFTNTIEYYDLSSFPPSKQVLEVFPPYNVYDSANGMSDTVYLTPDYTSDSTWFYIVDSESNDYYTNRSTYLNNTFAINPPSIGVVTFDGLDEFGLAYDMDNPRTVAADELSSLPINLGNLPDTSVYFSFFYQGKGLSLDGPENGDSLALDFFDASAQKWENVWRIQGEKADTFKQVIIFVADSLQENGFRFRFRNYANSSGSFDHWHIDYLYLDHGRSIDDTAYLDIAYVYDAPTLLKDYYAMPWFHFRLNPASFMTDSVRPTVVNSTGLNLQVWDKVLIRDTVPDTVYYRYPPTDRFVFLPAYKQFTFRYPLDFSYTTNDVNGPGTFEATYDIDFRPSMSQPQDFIRSNDTIIGKTILENYYAYDDGTAEAGYGINPVQGPDGFTAYMAVEFNMPIVDTIGGLQLYFLPQGIDIQDQKLELTVWNSLSPPNVIFSMPILYNPQFTDDNGYLTYNFDSLVEVNQTFYVGFKSIGKNSMNVGYDLNRNYKSKIFWSQDGLAWNNPSAGIQDGSLMLRPIFKETGIGVGISKVESMQPNIVVYPNPTNGLLNIEVDGINIQTITLMDIHGKLLLQQKFSNSVELSNSPPGIYFLQLISDAGQMLTKKIIISP